MLPSNFCQTSLFPNSTVLVATLEGWRESREVINLFTSSSSLLPNLTACTHPYFVQFTKRRQTVTPARNICGFAFCMLEQIIKICVRLNVNAFMVNWHTLCNVYFCNFILLYSLLILHSEGEKGSFSADLMKTLPWQMRNQPVCSGVWLKRMLIFCLNTAFKEIIQGSLWHGTQWPASKC